jgi:hypothetical protein
MVTQTIYASDYTTTGGTMSTLVTWALLDKLNTADGHYRRRPLSVEEADSECRQAWMQVDDAAEATERIKILYSANSDEVQRSVTFYSRALVSAIEADNRYRQEYARWQEILGRLLNNPDCTCAPMGDACPRCVAVAALKALDAEELEYA